MSKDVRLGRKEGRRDRNAKRNQTFNPDQQKTDRERETRKRQKAASKNRSAEIKDLFFLYNACGVPGRDQLLADIETLVEKVTFGGVPVERHADSIFDPAVIDLTRLPLGLLCGKEATLPVELIPDTRRDLEVLCRRMISRNQDEAVIERVVEGWPGSGLGDNKFQEHVTDLWKLFELKSPLYGALVRGLHGEAILALRHDRLPQGFTRERMQLMLTRHGLLFCTNDIQLNLARNAVAERNPMEALISSTYVKLAPERVVNDFRPYLTLLKLLLRLYVTEAQNKAGVPEPTEVPNEPIAKSLEAALLSDAEKSGLNLMASRATLDGTVPFIDELLAKADLPLLQMLEGPVSANELETSFSAIWFSGLSNLSAAAVPILRYVQAEVELEDEIRWLVPQAGDTIELRGGTALRPFSPKRLPKGWRNRAKDLLHAYRQSQLRDADVKAGEERNENTGRTSINQAADFLVERGERLIPDHQGGPDCSRRTYYLLDIVPEHRLALQGNMLQKDQVGRSVVVAKI